MLPVSQDPDYYALLSVSRASSASEIKLAYHRALLASHPDKQRSVSSTNAVDVDVGLIQRAYVTLTTPDLRIKYDSERLHAKTGPRPAQVVSLEEFLENADDAEGGIWTYDCRCGGCYIIKEDEMERDQHLVGCTGCSEVVWVGYELADADGTPDTR